MDLEEQETELKDEGQNLELTTFVENQVKTKLAFPLTAKFDGDFGFNVQNVPNKVLRYIGKVSCKNAFNVPVEYRFDAWVSLKSNRYEIVKLQLQ